MDEYAVMAGWARERLIAVRRATPVPGGDVAALAREVAGVYGELAAFLPEVQPPSGDPERWAPDAVVKAGAAVVGVLDELRNPEGPGKKRDLPELFFAASLERTLTGSPAGVEAACVSALTGDAEQLWARAFGKLLVYAVSVPVVGLIDDLTGMLAEAVAARRWTNLHRQVVVCGNELVPSPVALPELVEPPAALPESPGQVTPRQPDTASVSRPLFRRRGPMRRLRRYRADTGHPEPPRPTPEPSADHPERVPRPSTSPAGTSGSPWPPAPPPSASAATTPPRPQPPRSLQGVPPKAPGAPGNTPPPTPRVPEVDPPQRSVTLPPSEPRRRSGLPLLPPVVEPTPPAPASSYYRDVPRPGTPRPRSSQEPVQPPSVTRRSVPDQLPPYEYETWGGAPTRDSQAEWGVPEAPPANLSEAEPPEPPGIAEPGHSGF
ncbi:hypothetical protein [Streptomyces mirabilis]|uniref:hypothetical protein n=1 Tax=Streptomyces mirabilis TaxID=68239 RepID=UPI0033A5CF71